MHVYHFVWSGSDYFQCDREIRFMCAGGTGGAKSMAVDGCMLVSVCIVFVFRI